jgi:antitoxin VapB
MALSIRNAKAEKLARELAAESGDNITQAITRALEERLQRLRVIMARLMISAAVPCMGALMAVRSAAVLR